MKLTVLFLTAGFLNVCAKGVSQNVSFSGKSVSLEAVFTSVQKQTGFLFLYSESVLQSSKPISINAENVDLKDFLFEVFKSQPLEFDIKGQSIIVTLKETPRAPSISDELKITPIRGKVLDEDGQPLAGASISVKNTQTSGVTNAEGVFTINVNEGDVLVITYVEHQSKEVKITSSMISSGLFSITLSKSTSQLDEVVVNKGYYTESKKFSTSNITSIKADVIERQPVSNPLLALQGRAPGLFIEQTSGLSTGSVNVTVQGKNSLKNSNQPFYVVDGVPYTPNSLTTNVVGSIAAGSPSNLNFINPGDIESIEILKDADATAIYGSRAANGAILITTKRGKAGQTRVGLNMQTGWGKLGRMANLLTTKDFIAMRKEAKQNGNQPIFPSDYDINGVWDTTRNTNWQKELLGGTAQYQNLQASISGGTDRTQFLAGAGYLRETTVFDGDFSNVKASVHFNISHSSTNNKFKFFMSGNYLQGNNKMPQSDITSDAVSLAPDAPPLYNSDGTLNWQNNPNNPNEYTFDNPLAKLLETYRDKTNNLIGNSQISYELLSGLSLKSSFGYNRLESDELMMRPLAAINPGYVPRIRTAKYGSRSVESWIIEPQIVFNKSYSFGTIDGLGGATFQNTDNYVLGLEGSEYSNDAQLPNYNAAGKKNVVASDQSTYRYSAVFARLNYRYRDRYIINVAARRDGSSRFGAENLFHSFYSVGGAWIFSEEDFFKSAFPVLNFGKLRASYGTTGNDQISDYRFYSLYDNYSVTNAYQNTVGLVPRGLPNPYLQWEETRKINLGLELGFFDNRLFLNANYFRNRSTNQLLSQSLTYVTGFPTIDRNFPALVQNTGWELNLDFTPLKGRSFSWTGSINLTLPKNKLLKYDGLAESGDNENYVIGQSINIRKVYEYAGVDPQTGLYQFRDAKGVLTYEPQDPTDRTKVVNLEPTAYGGLDNTFSYRGFDLNIFFQYSKQRRLSTRFGSFPGTNANNNPAILSERWRQPGDQALIQKVSTDFGEIFTPIFAAQINSDEAFSDATYVRLKNASLSYSLKPNLVKRIGLSSARVYVQGQNLLTITNYFGGSDPETVSSSNLGTLRTISIGAQLTF